MSKQNGERYQSLLRGPDRHPNEVGQNHHHNNSGAWSYNDDIAEIPQRNESATNHHGTTSGNSLQRSLKTAERGDYNDDKAQIRPSPQRNEAGSNNHGSPAGNSHHRSTRTAERGGYYDDMADICPIPQVNESGNNHHATPPGKSRHLSPRTTERGGYYDDMADIRPIPQVNESGSKRGAPSGNSSHRSQKNAERGASAKSSKFAMDENLSFLQKQGFPRGLAQGLVDIILSHPIRIWVVDNSGSMMSSDGQTCILGNSGASSSRNMIQVISCTRWLELQETVSYHTQLSSMLKATSTFRFLNDPGPTVGPQEFSIYEHSSDYIEDELRNAQSLIKRVKPGGATPLTQHLREIREKIKEVSARLKQKGQHAVVVLATDGLPTNEMGDQDGPVLDEFIETLKSLQALPVWIVVRLCTNEIDVVNFYNRLDSKLELPVDVLDDFFSEASEVHKHNPWLNYSLHIHRCREFGYHNRIFDLLDERPLTKDELAEFMVLTFGEAPFDGMPSIHTSWKGFLKVVLEVVSKERKQWNPISKKLTPWIDVAKLETCYGNRRYRFCGC